MEEAAKAANVISKRLKGKSYRDAAERLEKKKVEEKVPKVEEKSPKAEEQAPKVEEQAPKKSGAKKNPSGLVPEVVITRQPQLSPKGGESVVASAEESDNSLPRKRKRRAAANAIVVSDDDDDESEGVKPKKKTKTPKASSSKARKRPRLSSPESDYKGSSGEDDDDEDVSDGVEEFEESGEESEPKPKAKSKAKGKGKAKAKPTAKKAASSAGSDDGMDVDEPEKPAKKAKKPAKELVRKKRTDNDPWKLGSRPVQQEWTKMQAPPFEMFHWSRTVVDEYTYLDGKIHSLVTHLSSNRQWVLSGTPPIHDFGALKTIAAFLDVHLGVDDDGEGQSVEVKKRRREQTGTLFGSCQVHGSRLVSCGEVPLLPGGPYTRVARPPTCLGATIPQSVRSTGMLIPRAAHLLLNNGPEHCRNRRDSLDREECRNHSSCCRASHLSRTRASPSLSRHDYQERQED